MKNTCKIKFLPKAYIGNGIRMTKDKSTLDFDNKPMTGLKIENYGPLGFQISHANLPKVIWVEFGQLPLTRLTIVNSIIQDEITFVENIINHQMQLIRTLDTEYIDLIYATKELEQKEDKIIPITKAIPGQIYQGARCDKGTKMIFLGNFYTKTISKKSSYSYYNKVPPQFFIDKSSPRKAFFAIVDNNLNSAEIGDLVTEFDCDWWDRPDRYSNGKKSKEQLNHERAMFDEREEKCDKAKAVLLKATPIRYMIINYPITSKVIKNVIIDGGENESFNDIVLNKTIINQESVRYSRLKYDHNLQRNPESIEFHITLTKDIDFGFKISQTPNYAKVYISKTDISKKFRTYVETYGNQPLELEER